jgi:hypothetical protein
MCVRALRVIQDFSSGKNERFGGTQSVCDICGNHLINEQILKYYEVLDFEKSINLLKIFNQQNNESAQKPNLKKLNTK